MGNKFLSQLLLQVIFVVFHWQITNSSEIGKCSNVSNGESLKCCKNYRLVSATCEECWPGTFGENCKDNCPSDHYGKFCKEICQCTPCDKALGCLRQTASSSIDSDDSPPVWDWSITFICLSGGCVLCVGVGLVIFWKSRKRHPRHNGDLEIKGTSANGRSHQTAEESSKCQKKVLFNNFKAKNIDIKLCSSNQGKEGNVYGHHNVALEQYDTLDLKIKANTDYWA